MNWKNYVEKQNERTFVLPEGWDSRAQVADNLGCSEERVDELLRPGIKSGEIEKQQFRVWQSDLKRIVTVVAYRKREVACPCVEAKAAGLIEWTPQDIERARELKASGKSWPAVAAEMGRSMDAVRNAVRRAAVAG